MSFTNILVLGAGELGTAILKNLSKISPPSTKLTVLLRPTSIISPSPSKATELSRLRGLCPDLNFLPFDITSASVSSLANVLRPYDVVISCLGFGPGLGPGSQLKVARSVIEAGVRRFVPWQFGVDYDVIGRGSAVGLFDEQIDVREMLRAQAGTEWIIVSPGIFMSFLFEDFWGVVDLGQDELTVRALGAWENKVTVTTPDDIGRLTALILFSNPRIKNEIIFVAGQTISYSELAKVIGEVTGKRVKKEVWSVESLERELEQDTENAIRKYRVVFAKGKGCWWDDDQTWNMKMVVETVGIRDWMLRNRLGES